MLERLFRRWQGKAVDISALTWSNLFGEDAKVSSGVAVNIDSALKVATVFACARVLANGIAQVPLKLYRSGADDSSAPAKDHPLYNLLWRRPNEWMTSFEFRQTLMFHAVLAGNAYAYIGRGGVGTKIVQELIPLSPGRVIVHQFPDYTIIYRVTMLDGTQIELPREAVLHIRGPSWNGYAGMDAVQVARESIGLAIALEQTQARLQANGARPSGVLSIEGTLSEKARRQLIADWREQYEAVKNAGRTVVLDNSAKYQTMTMTGVESQQMEQRRFQVEQICSDLGVFPQMIGYTDKTATFASAESFFIAHVVHSLTPWAENWEQSLARDLFPDEDDIFAKFSLQGLMRGDAKSRAEFYASGIVNGWLTRNDARKREDLNPLPGLDEPLVPLNMISQGDKQQLQDGIVKAVKSVMIGHNGGPALDDETLERELETKIGRVLSANNERRIVDARDELNQVLATLPPVN